MSASDTFQQLLRTSFGEVVAKAFGACKVQNCGKRSLGWICAGCGQFCCNGHGFLTLELKPQVMCTTCIAADASEET